MLRNFFVRERERAHKFTSLTFFQHSSFFIVDGGLCAEECSDARLVGRAARLTAELHWTHTEDAGDGAGGPAGSSHAGRAGVSFAADWLELMMLLQRSYLSLWSANASKN